jgi:hypothetical protein
MKYFLIKYSFMTGSEEEWHREIARFVAALDSEPVLKGKISYRSTKHKGRLLSSGLGSRRAGREGA